MPSVQEADIYWVQGDLDQEFEAVLLDSLGDPIDLTAALQVIFQARLQTRPFGWTGEARIEHPTVDPVTHLPTGKVSYSAQAGNTDKPGLYDCDFKIEWPHGAVQTVPNYTTRQLLIRQKLA